MNKLTGSRIQGLAHLRQSVEDILSTPLGSRVMNRSYGSNLFELTDAPMNRNGVMDVIAATAEALAIWEPRLKVSNVTVGQPTASGTMQVSLSGIYTPTGKEINLDGIVI